MSIDVFLSYASEDRDRVRPLVDALKAQEFEIQFEGTDPTEQGVGNACNKSRGGLLDCHIKANAKGEMYYDYKVKTSACGTDPRVYVP